MSLEPRASSLMDSSPLSSTPESKPSPSDAYFASIAGSVDKGSPLQRRDESPMVRSSSLHGESAPGARRVPRGSVIPRTLDPVKRTGAPEVRSNAVPPSETAPSPRTADTSKSAADRTPTKPKITSPRTRVDVKGEGETELLFGNKQDTVSESPSPGASGSVQDNVKRLNSSPNRGASPSQRRDDQQRRRQSLIFRSRGSFTGVDQSPPSNPSPTHVDYSGIAPTSYSPLWRLSKGPIRPRNSDASLVGGPSTSSHNSPEARRRDPNRESVSSTSGFMADIDTPPGSALGNPTLQRTMGAKGTAASHAKGTRVTVTSRYRNTPGSMDTAGSEDDDEIGLHAPDYNGADDSNPEHSDADDSAIMFLEYRPSIVPLNSSSMSIRRQESEHFDGEQIAPLPGTSVSSVQSAMSNTSQGSGAKFFTPLQLPPRSGSPSSVASNSQQRPTPGGSPTKAPPSPKSPKGDLSPHGSVSSSTVVDWRAPGSVGSVSSTSSTRTGSAIEMSPLSETIHRDRFHPIYHGVSQQKIRVPAVAAPPEKKILPIADHPGAQTSPKLADHFDARPTRGELRRELSGGNTIDRSDWVAKVLARNPDVSNIRERVQPLHRAISFCELYNRGRGKMAISKDLMLQLIMQYFDHEGLRGPLKVLEKESHTNYQFRNLDELQLLDARLISLVMIALNDIETIWDIAMGEKASNRLQRKPEEPASLSTNVSSTSISSSNASNVAGSTTSAHLASTLSSSFDRRDSSASTVSGSGRSIRITTATPGSHPGDYDESTFNMSQDPEVASRNAEILEEMLAALRLREQDQFVGYSPSVLTLDGDINIWEDPYEDQLILEPDTGQISGGSLNRLVELLTPIEEVDLVFVRAFLVTYQLFTTSTTFLAKLSQRYNAPRDPSVADDEWRKRVLPIQIRVVNVIKMWIEEFHSDFDDLTISSIRDFLNFQVREYHPTLASATLFLLDKFCARDSDGIDVAGVGSGPSRVVQFSFSVDPPRPIVPKNIFSPHLRWDEVDEEEIARQLTLIEFEYFYKIRTSEFLHQSWSKVKLKHRAPHIISLIRRFNAVSEWVGTQIVLEPRLRIRTQVLTKLIGVADHLRKLQNFNTLMAFVAVFNSAAVGRLKHTFSELAPRTLNTLNELKTLMRPDDAYMNYRTELEESIPPCVPYLGLYLTELTHAEDGQPNLIDGLVNFSKCRLIHSIIAHINAHQQKGYNIQAVYQIQQFLRDPQPRLGDKAIFSHSTLIEPRGFDKAQIVQ